MARTVQIILLSVALLLTGIPLIGASGTTQLDDGQDHGDTLSTPQEQDTGAVVLVDIYQPSSGAKFGPSAGFVVEWDAQFGDPTLALLQVYYEVRVIFVPTGEVVDSTTNVACGLSLIVLPTFCRTLEPVFLGDETGRYMVVVEFLTEDLPDEPQPSPRCVEDDPLFKDCDEVIVRAIVDVGISAYRACTGAPSPACWDASGPHGRIVARAGEDVHLSLLLSGVGAVGSDVRGNVTATGDLVCTQSFGCSSPEPMTEATIPFRSDTDPENGFWTYDLQGFRLEVPSAGECKDLAFDAEIQTQGISASSVGSLEICGAVS